MAINGQSVLGVIPARGGSKRIPRKNLREWKGKTLLQWAVESARESAYMDEFCVSSEDKEILEHASCLGVETCERPDWLATDKATSEGVLVHVLYTWKWADWIVLLQPTSPQRTGKDIDECIERSQLGNGCTTFNEHGQRNGAVYVARSEYMIANIKFVAETFEQFLIMPNGRSLDINYPQDLDAA